MSNFWDNIIVPSTAISKPVEKTEQSNFWAGIMGQVEPKIIKKKVVKAKLSKAVVDAGKVYETVDGIVVPAEDCKHHWIIPSDTAWAIGVCKLCNGERWFSNRFKEEGEYKFNDTLVPPRAEESIDTTDADIRDITTVYKAEQDSAEGSE